MAKPLGPKSRLIRQAISANPQKGNTELAEMLSAAKERKEDKITVTAQDVAQQRQAMKKAGAWSAGKKRGRPRAAAQTSPAKQAPPPAAPSSSPVDLIDKTFDLAKQCGGVAALKKLVDRLAEMQRG